MALPSERAVPHRTSAMRKDSAGAWPDWRSQPPPSRGAGVLIGVVIEYLRHTPRWR